MMKHALIGVFLILSTGCAGLSKPTVYTQLRSACNRAAAFDAKTREEIEWQVEMQARCVDAWQGNSSPAATAAMISALSPRSAPALSSQSNPLQGYQNYLTQQQAAREQEQMLNRVLDRQRQQSQMQQPIQGVRPGIGSW